MADDAVFPKKWDKKLPENFKESCDGKSTEELKAEIVKASRIVSDLEHDMEIDPKLNSIKEDLKALAGGYKDEIGAEVAKVKFCLFTLKQRGVTSN